jgi:hypothetical protein
MPETEPTLSLYRGIEVYWYRYAEVGKPITYTTVWYLHNQPYHGPARRDVADAVQAAEKRIDAQLRNARRTHDAS